MAPGNTAIRSTPFPPLKTFVTKILQLPGPPTNCHCIVWRNIHSDHLCILSDVQWNFHKPDCNACLERVSKEPANAQERGGWAITKTLHTVCMLIVPKWMADGQDWPVMPIYCLTFSSLDCAVHYRITYNFCFIVFSLSSRRQCISWWSILEKKTITRCKLEYNSTQNTMPRCM